MANFGDYPGDVRLKSGDGEKRFKIWSLPDYLGELTALQLSLTPKMTTTQAVKTSVTVKRPCQGGSHVARLYSKTSLVGVYRCLESLSEIDENSLSLLEFKKVCSDVL